MHILFIVGSDIERAIDGRIIVGPETQYACDKAIEHFHTLKLQGKRTTIVVTAGKTGKKWDDVSLSKIMGVYLKHSVPHAHVNALRGAGLDTNSQVRSLLSKIANKEVNEIIVCVSRWQWLRTSLLLKARMAEVGLELPITFLPCRSNARILKIVGEALKVPAILCNYYWKRFALSFHYPDLDMYP